MNMNRRQFLKTALAAAVVATLPALPEYRPYINAAYPPGDIRRDGAVEGRDCTTAVQAAIDDQTQRDIGIYFPAGNWPIYSQVSGTVKGRKVCILYST
jgi:hypothetical protein